MYKYYLGKCGFFSELFNVINALLWFGSDMVLSSEHWIGTYEKGLEDYLDIKHFFQGDESKAENIIEVGRMSKIQWDRLVYARCQTHDIQKFFIDKIKLIHSFWKPYDHILKKVKDYEEKLGINGPYLSVHVRRGDNIYVYAPLEAYAKKINEFSTIENVYLMSDDDSIYKQLSELCPSKKFYSFEKKLNGWIEGNFYDLEREEKRRQIEDLIVDVEIARKSVFHIGCTSNVSRFIRFIHSNPANYIQLDNQNFDPF
jgi:hypothetical protein